MKIRATATALFSAMMVACSDPPPPPPPPPPEPAPEAAAPAPAPTEELEATEVAYSYTPVGKRDPFKSIFEDLQAPDTTQKLTELQRFQIDQLKIAAIITGRATPYAMVEDPNGKGHTLTRGTLIGKNYGRVAAINPDCVVVKEEYRDYTGRKVTNEFSMCLPKPEDTKLD